MIPTYYLSEVTRQQVTVALSGDGGDELFMGYPFLKEPAVFGLYKNVPRQIRNLGLRAILKSPIKGEFIRMAHHAYEKNYGDQSPLERYIMRITLFTPQNLKRIYGDEFLKKHNPTDTYDYMRNWLNISECPDTLHTIDYATIKSYLEEDILVKVDKMSMAVSLETRCPLLDHRLMKILEQIPSEMKMNGGDTKYILKKMAIKKNLIPREIVYRQKRGFGAPVENWLKGEWKELLSQLLDPVINRNYTGLFNREYISQLSRDPYFNSNRLFALMVFVLWYKMYIDEEISITPSNYSI